MTFAWLHSQSWYKDYVQNQHLKLFKKQFMLTTFLKYLPDPPEYRGEIGGKVLFNKHHLSGKVRRNDKTYRYTSVAEMERFLRWYADPTKGISDWNDCDDAAQRVNGIIKFWSDGLAQGIVDLKDPNHQRNWCYCDDDKFYQFEPRGNVLFPLEPDNIKWMLA